GDVRFVGQGAAVGTACGLFANSVAGERCECFDGNTVSGDGCDARCEVEPCFTCTGDPSVCTPSPDGGPCNDRNACTTGETCTAGVCGGGAPVIPCLSLTGQWLEHTEGGFFPGDNIVDITQVGTILEFGGSPTVIPGRVGTIDTMTGALMVS